MGGDRNGGAHPGPLPGGAGVWIPAFAGMTGAWARWGSGEGAHKGRPYGLTRTPTLVRGGDGLDSGFRRNDGGVGGGWIPAFAVMTSA